MLFKTVSIATQWASLHPEVRAIIAQLDAAIEAWNLPQLTVTDAVRSSAEQEENYWRAFAATGLDEGEARAKALSKFSWHLVACAVDLRGSEPWAPEDEQRVKAWLDKRCARPKWEVLFHEVGKGMHFHVAARDYGWRRRWGISRSRV